jgi:uncharacterized lipoprotein YmbA
MRTVALLSTLLLLGCSTATPVAREQYLMRSDAPDRSERVSAASRVGIRRVTVASYLDHTGLALETAPNQIRNARYHDWAEPLPKGLRSLLRSELSRRLGEDVDGDAARATRWTYAIDVTVDQLHGTASGDALLVASWRVERVAGNESIARYRFTQRRELARPGYAALAEAQIKLTKELAGAIAESLAEAP